MAETDASAEEIVAGEDALVATTSLLYQKLQGEQSFEKAFKLLEENDVGVFKVASSLHPLLTKVFDGEEWPKVRVNSNVIDECFDLMQGALRDALDQTDDDLIQALNKLTNDMADDERLQNCFERIRAAQEDMAEEGEEEEEGAADEEEGDEEKAADEAAAEADDKAAKDSTGANINVDSFDELVLTENIVRAANDCWKLFISNSESREAAGEAIYSALFESAPSLQSLFVTPRAVQAMRFMNGIASFVAALDDPPKLKILVETLGFGHLHLDVTPPRVVIFRDAIVDLLQVELAERFTPDANRGWTRLLNYVGGAIIYIKQNYAERITCLLKSWKLANMSSDEEKEQNESGAEDAMGGRLDTDDDVVKGSSKKSGGFFSNLTSGKKNVAASMEGMTGGDKDASNALNGSHQNVPTTYPDMFKFNAAVMGFGTSAVWMHEILDCFHNIVTNVSNSARLQEECDILALRIDRAEQRTDLDLGQYKACMLASLRSLLPKQWDSAHEVAWTWLWENVERLVLRLQGQPRVWMGALGAFLETLDESARYEVRKDIYNRFFSLSPAGQDYFKQSNTYLHIVADRIINMTLELFQNPVKMVDDISALGLRHVGYAIPVELFGPFVTASVEALMARTSDENTVASFRWSLGLVSKMLVRTITEGSTIVMKAINANSSKMLKKAIGCAPRGERSGWMLVIQVGTQKISPFAWSVESGNFEAAISIMRDLLTFRADRDRYYYGEEDLFKRHPDVIKMLCDNAPSLVPKLLDGLIWRSRTTEGGMRKVNYYIKHLLIDEEGNFAKTLAWLTSTKDPQLVCHPVCVLVADIVWSKVAYRSFLFGKSAFLFTVLVFIVSQSVLEHATDGDHKEDWQRACVFGCRVFIYLLSMMQLLYCHIRDVIRAFRKKDTVRFCCFKVPKYLLLWQSAASLVLTFALLGMVILEPIFWCWPYQHGKLFNADCDERKDLKIYYSIFGLLAMFLYYVLLIDLTVVSTRISAFTLVCVRMLSEVALFLGALAGCILTFSSAMSVVCIDNPDFTGIPKGAYALFRIAMGAYDASKYAALRHEPTLLIAAIVFIILAVLFLLSMLIAQLSCAYSAVYEDMVGYARLERAETIVEIMRSVSKMRWENFINSLHLNKRLEFNTGDVGVRGGMQMREAANIHPQTTDMIKRFGGSTSVEAPWPLDADEENDDSDRLERFEKYVQKSFARIAKSAHSSRRGGGASGTGTGTGTGSSGEGSGGGGGEGSGSGSSGGSEAA